MQRSQARDEYGLPVLTQAAGALFLALLCAGDAAAQKYESVALTSPELQADEFFGHGVAIDGNLLVVGASRTDDMGYWAGSVYVFRRDPSTRAWSSEAKLLASDGFTYDRFGMFVSVDGDLVGAGARTANHYGQDSGAAYLFRRDPLSGEWWQEAKLLPSDGAPHDHFGVCVNVDGDTALVGAYQNDHFGPDSGAAYVFRRDPLTGDWYEAQKIVPADGEAGDKFGHYFTIDGDVAVIGSLRDDDNGPESGSAYVYREDPVSGLWIQEAKLLASDGDNNDQFGISAAVHGDVIIVGAFQDDPHGNTSGSAYIFRRDAGTGYWDEEAKLVPADGAEGDYFGSYVAVENGVAVVGAWEDDTTAGSDTGSAYVFAYDPVQQQWREHAKLLASDAGSGDIFGRFLTIGGGTVVVGARGNDRAIEDGGTVFLYPAPLFRIQALPATPVAGGVVEILGEHALARSKTWLFSSIAGVGVTPVPAVGVDLNLASPRLLGAATEADSGGTASWTLPIPVGASGKEVWIQVVQDQRKTDVFRAVIE